MSPAATALRMAPVTAWHDVGVRAIEAELERRELPGSAAGDQPMKVVAGADSARGPALHRLRLNSGVVILMFPDRF